jgi:trigger factor
VNRVAAQLWKRTEMTVTETLNEGLKRGFSLRIPAGAIAARVDAAVKDVAPRVRMPGFRPGKVPSNLVRKMHGEALRADAIREAVDEGVKTLLAERSLRPAMQPRIDLEALPAEGEDIVVEVAMEVLPDIAEVKIEGIALEKLVVAVEAEAVEAELQRLADGSKTFADAPEGHAAGTGDLVVMDFAGTVDGVAFEGGTGSGMEIELGSGRLIPGFEDQLLGATVGEARTVKLTIPADYPSEAIAGKDAEFAVTVTAVRQASVPAIDEDLAKNLGLDSLEALKDILKERVERELGQLSRTYMKRKLLDHLAATHDFAVPPSMVEAEFEQIWRTLMDGAPEEDRTKAEEERGDYVRIAERRVRLGLLLSEIGQKNGIAVTNAEMNRLVAEEAARYPGQEAEVRKYFSENAMAAAQLRAPLFEEKVVDFLLGKAEVTERAVSRAELEAAIESEDETPLGAGEAGHLHGPDCDHDHDHGSEAAKPKKKAAPKKAKAAEPAAEAAPEPAEAAADAPKPKKRATKKAEQA